MTLSVLEAPAARLEPISSREEQGSGEREARLCARIFWAWIALRTAAWTLLVTFTQPNAPLDLIEWLTWGHEWRLGYHKHPPLPAWLAECFSQMASGSMWGVYLGSYLITAIGLWAVWRLGREVLSPRLALLGVLCLDGVIFFTADAAEFNNNVVLNACWALTILCFHRALCTDARRWWLGLGLAVGLSLLSKYSVAFLLVCMIAFMLLQPSTRRLLARPGPYLAAMVAGIIFAPHWIWAIQNDFPTLRYAMDRAADDSHWLHRFTNPFFFALSQLGRLIPLVLILVPLISWRWRPTEEGQRFNRSFLLAMVLWPFGLHLALALCMGLQLREIWGYPLWSFTGLMLLACLVIDSRRPAFRRAMGAWAVVFVAFLCFSAGKNYFSPMLFGSPSRIHFPGQELAQQATRLWSQHFAEPLPLVAGDSWLASNIGCYARNRPSVYFSPDVSYLKLDPHAAPWTSDDDLRRRGGVLVWDAARYGDHLPAPLASRFPRAQVQEPVLLPFACAATVPPARVGMALLCPAKE